MAGFGMCAQCSSLAFEVLNEMGSRPDGKTHNGHPITPQLPIEGLTPLSYTGSWSNWSLHLLKCDAYPCNGRAWYTYEFYQSASALAANQSAGTATNNPNAQGTHQQQAFGSQNSAAGPSSSDLQQGSQFPSSYYSFNQSQTQHQPPSQHQHHRSSSSSLLPSPDARLAHAYRPLHSSSSMGQDTSGGMGVGAVVPRASESSGSALPTPSSGHGGGVGMQQQLDKESWNPLVGSGGGVVHPQQQTLTEHQLGLSMTTPPQASPPGSQSHDGSAAAASMGVGVSGGYSAGTTTSVYMHGGLSPSSPTARKQSYEHSIVSASGQYRSSVKRIRAAESAVPPRFKGDSERHRAFIKRRQYGACDECRAKKCRCTHQLEGATSPSAMDSIRETDPVED